MNAIDAAHKTVKDYPGGSEALGVRIGMSPAVLRSKVNPNTTTHKLGLEEAILICSVTNDLSTMQAAAAELGCVLRKVEVPAVPGGFVESMLRASSTQGALAQAVQDALSDGVISANELRLIESIGLSHQEAIMTWLGSLTAMSGKRALVAA